MLICMTILCVMGHLSIFSILRTVKNYVFAWKRYSTDSYRYYSSCSHHVGYEVMNDKYALGKIYLNNVIDIVYCIAATCCIFTVWKINF